MNLLDLLEALKNVPGDAAIQVRVRVILSQVSVDATGLLKDSYYDPTANVVTLSGDNP